MKFPSRILPGLVVVTWICIATSWNAGGQAASPSLISQGSVSSPAFIGGSGDSVSPWISPDGRFVLYSSTAGDLVSDDNGWLNLDVFLRDRAGNTTTLVSENLQHLGGGNGPSTAICVSTNGRYVLFDSSASDLVENDVNRCNDLFVRDCINGTTALVSAGMDGGVGGRASSDATMTPDGRYVVFVSAATNLVANDTNSSADVFVRDLQSQTTTLVSVGATTAYATMASPVITPDGCWVAYLSNARGIVSGVSNASLAEIYLRDITTGATLWPSTNAINLVRSIMQFTGIPAPRHPVISDDGRYVTFSCGWTNCDAAAPSGTTFGTVILQFDAISGTTTIISTNGYPPAGLRDDVYGPEMTPDGRFVAFTSRQTNGLSAFCGLYYWDRQAGSNTVVSADLSGNEATNSTSLAPVLSADGRFVTFVSNATNLVANTVASGWHIYRRDLISGSTQLVDADLAGNGSTIGLLFALPSMSADGRFVSYSAPDGNLVMDDVNKAEDVFVWDGAAGTNEVISLRDPAVSINGGDLMTCGGFSLSDDGSRVAFSSRASNLTVNDTNGVSDVFVWDRTFESNVLVSAGMDGLPALGGPSFQPQISGDGRYVLFVSMATNLVPNDTKGLFNVFLRDLQSQTTTLLSITTNGISLGSYDPPMATMTSDAQRVVFVGRTNISGSIYQTFWRDLPGGTTRLVPNGTGYLRTPTFSTNGRRIAYCSSGSQLYVWDAIGQTNVYYNSSSVGSAAISPGGNFVLYGIGTKLYCYDLNARSNVNSWLSSVPVPASQAWSGDERYVAFVSATALVSGDTNALKDVYLCDLKTGALSLVSSSADGSTSGSASSDLPVFSADGRFVVYRSFATNILPSASISPGIFVFDRLTGSNQLVVARSPVPGPSLTSWPAISAHGDTIAFATTDPGLVTARLNRSVNAFACGLSVFSTMDGDSDGIPDWWTQQYFGHGTGGNEDHSLATDDADGDGMSNLQEFLAGTNPTDIASFLYMQITPTPATGTNVLLSWPAKAGRGYRVQFTDDLSSGNWQNIPMPVQVVGNQGYLTLTQTNLMRCFRVRCEP